MRLRDHQERAVDAAVTALADGGRAQVVMACGTGKTLVGRHVAVRLGATRTVVLVPSLALLAQTLDVWQRVGEFRALAVCSETDVADRTAPETGAAATTDAGHIAQFLRGAGPVVLFATYQSVARLADAYAAEPDLAPLDLVVFDEAHRAAADPDARFATALHDAKIPATRRLFLTATPRVHTADPDDQAGVDGGVFAGMGDHQLFGKRVYELRVAEAIAAGMLSDYQVLIVGVTDADAHQMILDRAPVVVGAHRLDAVTAATQIALARTSAEYGLRRILVFCNRVAASRRFAATMAASAALLPPDQRPTGELHALHIDGQDPAAARNHALALLEGTGDDAWTVVSNVRVLSEGVDCPSLDAVVFAEPRSSQVDVVQAVGRAIRLHPHGDRPAVILLPVYLAPGENGHTVLEWSAFRHVWQILRALRDHDARIGAEIRRIAVGNAPPRDDRAREPERIKMMFPVDADEAFAAAFTIRVIDGVSDFFDTGLARLTAYAARAGHARPTVKYIDAGGFRLGAFTGRCRRYRAAGVLDDEQIAALEALPGWSWHVFADRWADGLATLIAYADANGHARPPVKHIDASGYRVGQWASSCRVDHAAGKLTADQISALVALPGWAWSLVGHRWQTGLERLRAFAAEHGHAAPTTAHVTADGYHLGEWVSAQRSKKRAADTGVLSGEPMLTAAQFTALTELPGWVWSVWQTNWAKAVAVLTASAVEGEPPHASRDLPDGLREWASAQRRKYRAGRLSPEQAAELAAIPGWTWTIGVRTSYHRTDDRGLEHLRAYVAEHGHARVTSTFVTADGFALGSWIHTRRKKHRADSLDPRLVTDLEQLPGWSWQAMDNAWRTGYDRLAAHVRDRGSVPACSHVDADGYKLGSWTATQRQEKRRGRITPERIAALETIAGWTWTPTDAEPYGLRNVRAYAQAHGLHGIRADTVADERFAVGAWIYAQRRAHRAGTLADDRRALLEQIPGWNWGNPPSAWDDSFTKLAAYAAEHGHADPTASETVGDGFAVGRFVSNQRLRHRKGLVPDENVAALEALPGWSWEGHPSRPKPRRRQQEV